jgi:hypothetical protein
VELRFNATCKSGFVEVVDSKVYVSGPGELVVSLLRVNELIIGMDDCEDKSGSSSCVIAEETSPSVAAGDSWHKLPHGLTVSCHSLDLGVSPEYTSKSSRYHLRLCSSASYTRLVE